jgi:hypothetical protein
MLLELQMDEKEKEAFIERMTALVTRGKKLTHEARANDPDYKDAGWDFYGSCQACEAVETATKIIKKQK